MTYGFYQPQFYAHPGAYAATLQQSYNPQQNQQITTQQQAIANQNDCCCSTKMLIQETAAQNRYDGAINTQKILDALAQNKIEALQGKIQQLELAQSLNNVVRYPNTMAYNAGQSPFCNCGCGCYA